MFDKKSNFGLVNLVQFDPNKQSLIPLSGAHCSSKYSLNIYCSIPKNQILFSTDFMAFSGIMSIINGGLECFRLNVF